MTGQDAVLSYIERPTAYNRERVIKYNYRLVHSVTQRYVGTDDYEDLYSVGLQALNASIDRYNPEEGKFTTLATSYISGKIMNYLRDSSRAVKTPSQVHTALQKYKKHIEQLSAKLGRLPTTEEIATSMGVTKTAAQILEKESTVFTGTVSMCTGTDGPFGDKKNTGIDFPVDIKGRRHTSPLMEDFDDFIRDYGNTSTRRIAEYLGIEFKEAKIVQAELLKYVEV